MAEVKLTVSLSGPSGVWNRGQTYQCSDEEARRLVEAGFAVAISPKTERATAKRPAKETRVK